MCHRKYRQKKPERSDWNGNSKISKYPHLDIIRSRPLTTSTKLSACITLELTKFSVYFSKLAVSPLASSSARHWKGA